MPRQRRRIVLTTVVICLILIAVPFMLTWPQTQKERRNRELITAVRALNANEVEDVLKRRADPNTRSNPDAPSVYVQRIQQWFRRDTAITPEADPALNEALSAKNDDGPGTDDPTLAKTRIVKLLLEAGAKVNFQYPMSNPPRISEPPLVAASRNCPFNVVRLLLDYKADIEARTQSGNTALIEAALQKRTDVVLLLLHPPPPLPPKGAKVDATDKNGMTALMCAAQQDDVNTENALIQAHANVNLKNALGFTALKYAQQNGHSASVQLLQKNGAKE